MKRWLLIGITLLLGVWQTATAQPLAARLDRLVADTLLADSEVGIAVYDLDDDTLLYSHQADKLYRPASIQKLLTAITALEFLGKDHPFTTTLWHTGVVTPDSVLEGDLYVVGGFDPLFTRHDMTHFARSAREAGIKSVCGRIIADVSLKDTLKWGSGWCWDDDMPPLTPLTYERTDTFPSALRHSLLSEGISLADSTTGYACTFPDSVAVCLATCEHTLEQVLDRMMKKSDNLHAEAVFYHLAQAGKSAPYATAEEGAKMMEKLLVRTGLTPSRYRIADGSGVSLYNYLSPSMLLALLKYAWKHPHIYQPLHRSLPIAGIDGTLQHRMKSGSPAHRRVWAKTGTLTGVVSLAGYARAQNGHTLAFVLINQNTLKARPIRAWQDRFCGELCR